jgi:murein DD-endopeptidase MepM/ murein hydrolase activator NlpD
MKIIPPLRGFDAQGSGAFGAPRGERTHSGIDFACIKGSKILSVCAGKVTKLGYPYNPSDQLRGHLRYVQVTDIDGRDVRYFYINPSVEVGDKVSTDDVLGISQDLSRIYNGITPHFHFEVKENGSIINPNDYLGE